MEDNTEIYLKLIEKLKAEIQEKDTIIQSLYEQIAEYNTTREEVKTNITMLTSTIENVREIQDKYRESYIELLAVKKEYEDFLNSLKR